MLRRHRGFTLIELIITVVIIGILASIAIPSYQESVRRSRRAELQTAMTALAHALERYYTQNNSYEGAKIGNGGLFPDSVPNGPSPNYTLILDIAAGDQDYTITAVPASGGPQQNDKCGKFFLTAAGKKDSSGPKDQCWTN